jgi:hypothetical protein
MRARGLDDGFDGADHEVGLAGGRWELDVVGAAQGGCVDAVR